MKVKRRIALLLMVCVLMMTLAVTAFATAEKPYGIYETTITEGNWLSRDKATARITRCDCGRVDNYLMAGLSVQYESGGYYYWTPNEDYYYYSSGEDTDEQTKSIKKANINCAAAWYQARCGTGSQESYFQEIYN